MPPSDIFDHGKDHGFAFGALENELIQLIPHAIFGVERRIALPNLGATGQNACCKITDLAHQITVFLHINESASDDLGRRQNLTVAPVDHGNHNDESVLRQMLAVPQNHVTHVAHAQAVHENSARGNGSDDLCRGFIQLNDVTDVCNEDAIPLNAHALRKACATAQVAVFAVNGNKNLGRVKPIIIFSSSWHA